MERKRHVTDIVISLSLFCVFAVLALFVVVLGANVYKGISRDMQANTDARSSIIYLTEKVRQTGEPGQVEIGAVGGSPALILYQHEGGQAYATWIFVSEGQLREVTLEKGRQAEVQDGQQIMALQALELHMAGGDLMQIAATGQDGQVYEGAVALVGGGIG